MKLDFPIVDAHQHFWHPGENYYPWLCDEPPIRFRYGDYRAIRKAYLPSDYFADAGDIVVEKTVYIETEWNPADPLGEMRYVDQLRHRTGFPSVAIAQAWLDQANAAETLDQLAQWPFVRGIRHKPRANPTAASNHPGGMTDRAWLAGYTALAASGLHFELQTPWWHLHEASQLAQRFPHTPMVLNHTGLPADRSKEGIAAWDSAMQSFAPLPNVSVKISGLGQAGQAWTVEANRHIVLRTIDLFGPQRCMFASNFPVDGLCASYATIFQGFAQIVRDFSPTEQRALFRDNALRIYRLKQ